MADSDTYRPQRERSRSPRRGRSRSPNGRRSYSPRDESRNNNHQKRRSRSPMTGQPQQTGQSSNTGYNAPPPHHGSYEDRAARREQVMNNIRETSQQDRRVYVGNLSYDVKWHHLKDFMRQAGEVLYADVLLLPNGMSKVGAYNIVEYATREQAQHAIATLSNQNLMGRLIYVREDRESEPRFGPPGGIPRGGYSGGMGGGAYGGFNPMGTAGRQLYVSNLPFNIGWQDLKDLFRQAARQGAIIRADVHMGPDGRPKGSGIVVFESPDDARNAIQQFNGYEWNGRIIEVREDRFANPGMGGPGFGRGGYGAPRGGFGYGGRGGFAGRGGYGYGGRGGFGGHGGYDNNVSMPPNPFTDNVVPGTEKCDTIFVRNLPWSTSNEDLVELFQTIGKVEQAEIQYEPSGRSRGTGVVRFDNADTAETAIAKFQGYQYGGRPLNIAYAKYLNPQQNDNAMDTDPHAGLTQDQIM